MPARPVFHAAIGQFFVELREAKGWTQRQAEDLAKRRRLDALTRQVLWRLEQGKTKNLDPDVLRAVAALYEIPYEELVARWVRHRYQVEIEAAHPPASGAPETSTTERILNLEREAAAHHVRLEAIRTLTRQLAVASGDDDLAELCDLYGDLTEERRARALSAVRSLRETQPAEAIDEQGEPQRRTPRGRSASRTRRAASGGTTR